MTTKPPSIGITLTPDETAALNATARAGRYETTPPASVKAALRDMLARIRENELTATVPSS